MALRGRRLVTAFLEPLANLYSFIRHLWQSFLRSALAPTPPLQSLQGMNINFIFIASFITRITSQRFMKVFGSNPVRASKSFK